jgi:hypothetical protein
MFSGSKKLPLVGGIKSEADILHQELTALYSHEQGSVPDHVVRRQGIFVCGIQSQSDVCNKKPYSLANVYLLLGQFLLAASSCNLSGSSYVPTTAPQR